jgi:hypothetical protein
MDVVVHDLNPSFNEILLSPIIAVVGHHAVHEAIIERLEDGSFLEQVGAVHAWYTAQPGLHYHAPSDRGRGDPTPDSAVRYTQWLDLLPRYREACRRAVAGTGDRGQGEYLAERITSFNEVVSFGEQPQP